MTPRPFSSSPAVPTAHAAGVPGANRRRQNWIVEPWQDGVFIVAAPLVMLALAVATLRMFGAAASASWVTAVFLVFNVAHHMPTFIRIYGDVDLFRRFKWSFLLGPLVPFLFGIGVLSYINYKNYPIQTFFYLTMILALWDPWHFLMQHYGFMRIYDRPNAAPPKLAARLDLALCATWFVFIMLATGSWLPGILADLYACARVPLIFILPDGGLEPLQRGALAAALAVTLVYLVYIGWCWRKGYFISGAKLALCIITFGVMYIGYTPNPWIERLAPGWSFQVGFAVLGMVHVTQYLAIVWRYNRSLARRPERARPGLFRTLHARGGTIVACIYVIVCLAYGALLTPRLDHMRWLLTVLLAAGFTSTILHYYFDGFIWKVRHQQNRENLVMNGNVARSPVDTEPTVRATSWWDSAGDGSAAVILRRQLFYFGLPMAALTVGAWLVVHDPAADYLSLVASTRRLAEERNYSAGLQEAQRAVAAMEHALPFQKKLSALQPTAAHDAELATLIYDRSFFKELLIPKLAGLARTPEQSARHRDQVQTAIHYLERALAQGGLLGRRGDDLLTPEQARATLAHWSSIVAAANETSPPAQTTSVRAHAQ